MVQYDGDLGSPYKKGHVLIVGGRTTENAKFFNLSLKTTEGHPRNYALHFSVRFNSGEIERTSRENSSWGERAVGPNPLKRGEDLIDSKL